MASILPFDELNRLELRLRERFPDGKLVKEEDYDDIIDEMLDLFLLAYAMGNSVTNENLSSDYAPTLDDALNTVDERIAGKTWRERAEEYFDENGSVDDLLRIAETEMHRDANESALETAQQAGAKWKTWATMLDDRVRDTHDYLEGETVAIDEDFYTFDGDHASAPGLFALPQNNIRCRCELIFS